MDHSDADVLQRSVLDDVLFGLVQWVAVERMDKSREMYGTDPDIAAQAGAAFRGPTQALQG